MTEQDDDIPERAGKSGDGPAIVPTRTITPSQIDQDALKVVRRLQRFGYDAYLVGGCVRDLLLKRSPKDFDVVTSARPPEVRKLFRNCRLIGRRFRLAHIHFRGKIIETATFRAEAGKQENGDLLIRSDNVFGTEREDAYRRDFTVNALFYDPEQRVIIDHVGGLEDVVERVLRFIGDPAIRVQEDPVRIIRAIKFSARLDFSVEPETWAAVVGFREELRKSAAARLLDEIIRLLRSGSAEASFRLLWTSGVLEILLPELACYLRRSLCRGEERDPGCGMWAYLRALDRGDRELLSNAVVLSALLHHPVQDASSGACQEYGLPKKSQAAGEVARMMVGPMVARLRLPKREVERVQQLLSAQMRLYSLRGNHRLPKALMRRAFFPEALDLFDVGVRASRRGRKTLNLLRRAYRGPQKADPKSEGKSRRRRRPRKRVRSNQPGTAAPGAAGNSQAQPESPADNKKKTRRRRRRPRRRNDSSSPSTPPKKGS